MESRCSILKTPSLISIQGSFSLDASCSMHPATPLFPPFRVVKMKSSAKKTSWNTPSGKKKNEALPTITVTHRLPSHISLTQSNRPTVATSSRCCNLPSKKPPISISFRCPVLSNHGTERRRNSPVPPSPGRVFDFRERETRASHASARSASP